MKKVLAIVATESKAATVQAVREFEQALKADGCEIEFETLFLHEVNLQFCLGCKLCFDRGEQFCPLKDDRNLLIDKLTNADGVVFAAPSYAYQVPARLKNLFDRLAYTFHRPRFFHKVCTALHTRAIPIGKVQKYMEDMGQNMGFHPVKGCSLLTMAPMSDKQKTQFSKNIISTAKRFRRELFKAGARRPSLLRFMMFRTSRSGIEASKFAGYDKQYFREQGWNTAPYYYAVKLSLFQKLMGGLFDMMGKAVGKKV